MRGPTRSASAAEGAAPSTDMSYCDVHAYACIYMCTCLVCGVRVACAWRARGVRVACVWRACGVRMVCAMQTARAMHIIHMHVRMSASRSRYRCMCMCMYCMPMHMHVACACACAYVHTCIAKHMPTSAALSENRSPASMSGSRVMFAPASENQYAPAHTGHARCIALHRTMHGETRGFRASGTGLGSHGPS